MYRNNFRTQQMPPQNRQNMSFGNGNCGGRRNNAAEDCGRNAMQENCGCMTPVNDCGCGPATGCNCEPVADCCETVPECRECECTCPKPETSESGCKPSKKDPVSMMPLAMAYVPWQDYKDIYPEEEGWCKGTIFAQLDLDFRARRCN